MTIYRLKPAFQTLLRPFCRYLASQNIRPNHVTVSAIILSCITGFFISIFSETKEILFLVPLVLFIRMALNAIDGMLAREYDMKTPLGSILNELGDVISDTVLYLPFSLIPGSYESLITVVVILSIISEMAGVIAVLIGANRRYDGPMGKSDRAFAFGLFAFLLAMGVPIGKWISFILIILIILLVITIVNRSYQALKEIRS